MGDIRILSGPLVAIDNSPGLIRKETEENQCPNSFEGNTMESLKQGGVSSPLNPFVLFVVVGQRYPFKHNEVGDNSPPCLNVWVVAVATCHSSLTKRLSVPFSLLVCAKHLLRSMKVEGPLGCEPARSARSHATWYLSEC